MPYAANANRVNPAALVGALGVPGAFGAILIVGLAVKVVIDQPEPNPIGVTINVPPVAPDDPVEQPEAASNTSRQIEQTTFTNTPPDSEFNFEFDNTAEITTLPSLGDDPIGFETIPIEVQPVPPAPTFNPVSVTPRGNPGRWITDNDYRTSWINRGYSGVASFALEIGANGRVNDCRITASTGHDALDAATCRLLSNRARFNPAKDNSGNSVAGTYTSSVNWQIPE